MALTSTVAPFPFSSVSIFRSRTCTFEVAVRYVFRKIPGKRYMSCASRKEPSELRYTSTATVFSPFTRYFVMSKLAVLREFFEKPTYCPFTQR